MGQQLHSPRPLPQQRSSRRISCRGWIASRGVGSIRSSPWPLGITWILDGRGGDHRRADNRQRFRRHVVPRGVDPLGKQPKGIDSVEIGGQVSPRSLDRRDRRQRRP
jgi:hypothetical protein